MRILLAHSFYRRPGGEDRYVRQQHDLLLPGNEVRLLSGDNTSVRPGVGAAVGMTYSPRTNHWVRDLMESFGPDVIHVHNTYPALGPAVHLAAARLDIPLVMTVHNYRLRCPNGYMFTEGSACNRCVGGAYHNAVLHHCFESSAQSVTYAAALWWHRFILRLERKVQLFVCPSIFVATRLASLGIPESRIRVIRNFTDMPVEPRPQPGSDAPGIYVGRLSPEKGVDVLLDALAVAGDPPFRIAGDGPSATHLRELAREKNLTRTTFVGHLAEDEVRNLMKSARFLVIPSIWDENAPLAALEAMACGCPLIVSDVGGLPELAAEDRGIACRPGSVSELAAALSRLMNDHVWAGAASEQCLRFARSELSPQGHRTCLETVYRDTLNAHSEHPRRSSL